MKRKFLPLILIASLLGTPAPAFAVVSGAGDMARFMLLMMDMFSWMMGGNRNYNNNIPYGGYGGFPTGLGSFPGSMGGLNPYSITGLGALTGTGIPYNNPAMMGYPYSTNRLYGRQYRPGLYNYYNNPYYGYAAKRRAQPQRKPRVTSPKQSEKPAQVIVQPVIIQQPLEQTMSAASRPSPESNQPDRLYTDQPDRNQHAPVVITPPPVKIDIPTQYDRATLDPGTSRSGYQSPLYRQKEAGATDHQGRISEPYRPDIRPSEQSLMGEWLGINGEYLVFEGSHFRMVDNNNLIEGSYELKNGIMKAQPTSSDKPTYMQYVLQDDYLAFRTEDGQHMMFRRMQN